MEKILIAAGGTGGHIYPAVALAESLKETDPNLEIHFAGGKLSSNPFFSQNKYPFTEVNCAALSGGFEIVKSAYKIGSGVIESLRLIKSLRPNVVVSFGSYHTFPVLAAARLAGVPYVLHEANAVPGKVVKFFSKKAEFTGFHFPYAMSHLKGSTLAVSLPIRQGYRKGIHSQKEAREIFRLDPDRLTCLVFGGSQGAKALNKIVAETLALFEGDKIQFLHITGDSSVGDVYKKHNVLAYVTPFESRMHLAWSAADVALTRAGAGTIAEAIEFEVPTILVPFPHAADRHQDFNADFMVEDVKGGLKFLQKELDAIQLYTLLHTFINQPESLHLWSENMKNYKLQNNHLKAFHLEIIHLLKRDKR